MGFISREPAAAIHRFRSLRHLRGRPTCRRLLVQLRLFATMAEPVTPARPRGGSRAAFGFEDDAGRAGDGISGSDQDDLDSTPPPLSEKFLSRIKLVVWDFDCTVLKIHSYAEGIEPEEVDERAMDEDFVHLEFFQTLVRELVRNGVQVAVASFGRFEVIKRFLDRALPEGLFTRDNISTPSCVGSRDGYALRGGKNSQLDKLRSEMGDLRRHQVLFFDDDRRNVQWADARGYAFSIVCQNGFGRPEWCAGVREVEAADIEELDRTETAMEQLPEDPVPRVVLPPRPGFREP